MLSISLVVNSLPSKPPCQAWSLNPWRTRLVLNYKNIPYKTTWVEYPDIAPTFKSFGIPPNLEDGAYADYTIPAVKLPDGRYIMDSAKIAEELEKLYPDPPLYLDSPILKQLLEYSPKAIGPLRPEMMPKVCYNLLNPRSVEYFERTRAERFGMPLTEYAKLGGDQVFQDATPGLKQMGDVLRANGGPFCMGKTPSYADLALLGVLEFCKRMGGGVFERVVKIEPAMATLYEAGSPWLERNSY